MFENPVAKIQTMIEAMDRLDIKAECECFDTGIVRSIKMFEQVGMLKQPINVSLVMGKYKYSNAMQCNTRSIVYYSIPCSECKLTII